MKQIILSLLLSLSVVTLVAQDEHACYNVDPVARYRPHNVDFITMKLDVRFEPEAGKVIGKVQYTFKPIQMKVDTLFLDGPDIQINKVMMGEEELAFETTEKGVTIKFNETLQWLKQYPLEIDYVATPKKGIYFLGWNDESYRMRRQIWTQGQGIDNRHWIPSFDGVTDKLITETKITFNNEYRVISNGMLMKMDKNKDGTNTWHFKMEKPHVPYLVMIAIGEYNFKDIPSKSGVVSRQYFYPDRPETFEPMYQYSAEMMDYFEEDFGVPYPWQTYANVPVSDFLYGAMENTTATIFTDYYAQDARASLERSYISTNAHELTHQWFGDYITEWSGTHHWLHESFATHYAKHFVRHVKGEDVFNWTRRWEMRSSWAANKRDQLPVAHSKAGSSRHYPKGSLVIDMLRYVVGEEQYKSTITYFLKKHAYKNADTHDFYIAFMENLGINLDWFFDEWLYRGGEPEYTVSYEASKKSVDINVEQTHVQSDYVGLFKMPIVVQVFYKDGSKDEKMVWIEETTHDISFEKDKSQKVDYVLFDPNWQVLKTLVFEKEYEELAAQAKKAEHLIDRYEAVKAMRDISISKKQEDLIEIFKQETHHAVKSEILEQLGDDFSDDSKALRLTALKDDIHWVRRKALTAVLEVPEDMLASYEVLLEDESYVTIATALKKLSKAYPENAERYLETTKDVDGHYKNVRIAWLETAINNGQEKYLEELIDLAGPSFNHRTRTEAYNALRRLEMWDETMINNLFDGIVHFNRRLREPATRAFREFYNNESYRGIFDSYYEKNDWNDWQHDQIKKVMKRS